MNHTRHTPEHSILSSPLPGKIMKILVREGDRVEKGQSVFVIESMKMFHELRVTHKGRMTTIAVKEGDCVLPNIQIASLI
jgi:biotin carboxyl carrier protein